MFHEDLEIDKNSVPEIFANAVIVIWPVELFNGVSVAFLTLTHRRPMREGNTIGYRARGAALAFWYLGFGLDRRER
jgi:hypothetical protein